MQQVDTNGLTEAEFLERYNPGDYPRPSATADIVVVTDLEIHGDDVSASILLIRRGAHPYLGHWALPGGFMNPDETVGEAAKRELEEETGILVDNLEQLYTFSKPGRDPRTWVITVAHMARIDHKISVRAGDDAGDAQWFTTTATKQNTSVNLTLINNSTKLIARVRQIPDSEEFEIIENNGLAFDHAAIITCAIEKLLHP